MDVVVLIVFLIAVAIGAWVQATSGFALGLIVMAIVQLTGVMSLADAAAVISVLAFLNITVALFDTYNDVDKKLFLCLIAGQLPAIGVGVWILNYLGREAVSVLELIFGLFLVLGSLSLSINPQPQPTRSKSPMTIAVGAAGGIFGGMFAASGPIVGWFSYRQPIVIASIRASLLAMLGVTTITRTVIVTIDGIFNRTLLLLIACGVPVVFCATWFAKKYLPRLTDHQFRRSVFILTLAVGLWITMSSLSNVL